MFIFRLSTKFIFRQCSLQIQISDSISSSSGFSANIKMEEAECGLTVIRLNATNSEYTELAWPIDSPNYRPNSQCDWVVEVPDMEQIEIHFEKFELEDADSSGKCSRDFLRLTDEDVRILCVCHSESI